MRGPHTGIEQRQRAQVDQVTSFSMVMHRPRLPSIMAVRPKKTNKNKEEIRRNQNTKTDEQGMCGPVSKDRGGSPLCSSRMWWKGLAEGFVDRAGRR